MRAKKQRKITGAPERPRIPLAMAIRMFFLGGLAVAGAIYALVRHYGTERPPMLVPSAAPSEIPVEYDEAR